MAPSKRVKDATPQRPSRLLNLNKSPQAQKLLAAINTADSPLLRLPPEIRCRIYNFTFGDLVVRARWGRFHICHSSQACELQRRQNYDQRISYHPTGEPDFINDDSGFPRCQTQKRFQIPVHLLQVCRQIYHEAALKPFTEPTFDLRSFEKANPKLGSVMKKLVPTQARAIARIRIRNGYFFHKPSKAATFNLRGLKHVQVHFDIHTRGRSDEDPPLEVFLTFESDGGVEWLKSIGLKSMRFTAMAVGNTPMEDALASVLDWMKREEDNILGVAPKQT
jgi:hypothetical protein